MPAPKIPPKAKAKRLLLACWDVLYRHKRHRRHALTERVGTEVSLRCSFT